MSETFGIIWLICLTCILPIIATWLSMRNNINETNKRQEFLLKALENNPDMNVEEWLKKLAPKRRLIKEKLLNKLLWGIICLIAGAGIIIFKLCGKSYGMAASSGEQIFGGIVLAVGIALVANFFMGRKFLAREIEAEENNLTHGE